MSPEDDFLNNIDLGIDLLKFLMSSAKFLRTPVCVAFWLIDSFAGSVFAHKFLLLVIHGNFNLCPFYAELVFNMAMHLHAFAAEGKRAQVIMLRR